MSPLIDDESRRLAQALETEYERLSISEMTELSSGCRHLLATSGRMWRGRMVIAAAFQGPAPQSDAVRNAAQAVELLQLATLAHDDVIDGGKTRRGAETVSVMLGSRTAGLAGMTIFARAVELISQCGESAIARFAQTSRELCEGGMLEMRDLFNAERTAEEYFAAANRKTASAFSFAAGVGSELADAPVEVVERAQELGKLLGLAYQVWDDLVDLIASEEQSGKGRLTDVGQGLLTIPIVFASEESPEIRGLVPAFVASEIDESELVEAIMATGGVERSLEFADGLIAKATRSAESLPTPDVMVDFISDARQYHARVIG